MSSAWAAEPDPTALVVPVDVVALCVGEIDEQEATADFAGPTAVFVKQTESRTPAFLGGNVAHSFDDAPGASQLTQGVHLHWALPDALTHAGTSGGGLDFPACPNRWLVTRIQIKDSTPTARSWLLESDVVSEDQQTSQPVTVPVKTSVLAQGYGYLGRVSEPGAISEAVEPAATSLAEAAGTELTAVTTGEVGFAAYYPSCGSALGFHDQLVDVAPPAADPAALAYVVVGWYADPKQDPVQPGATAAALEKEQRWTFAPADPALSSSVYYGLVQGIAWSPHQTYIHNRPVQERLEIEAAIGGNPAEALSAYFNQKDKPPLKLFELLLDAFQLGQIDRFTEPRPNQLTKLEEVVHDAAFARMNAGHVFTLVVEGKGGEPTELVDLPPQLADALNLLNQLEQQRRLALLNADWYRWQLFADWYRIFEIDPSKINEAFDVAYRRYGGWSAVHQAHADLATAARAQRAAVEKQLAKGVRLRHVPATRYSQPADPSVLLTGEGIDFPERYGGDGRFDPQGNLVCRPEGSVLTAVTIAGTTIDASRFGAVAAPAGVPHAALVTALLREGCLLSTTIAAAISSTPAGTLEAALKQALAGEKQAEYAFTGEAPSPVAVNWWALDQWLPVYASWCVDYQPLLAVDRKTSHDTYPTRFVNANYRLDQDAGGALAYAPDGGQGSIEIDPATAAFGQTYSGSGHLTPTPPQTLASLLKGYLDSHDKDPSLEKIECRLGAAGFLVTQLAGLSELMTMRRLGIQLEVEVPEDSDYAEFTDAVRPIIGTANRVGPDLNGSFNPIRAGYLKLSLALVDVYGQKRKAHFEKLVCSDEMTTLVRGEPLPSVAYLQPRISQPSRLLFRWLAADTTGYEEATEHPAASPVCGWIVPNHLDGSLFLYSAQGAALGTLFLEHGGPAAVGWQSAPGSDATIDQDVGTVMQYQNPALRDLAKALKGASKETFTALWKAIDTVGDTVEPGHLPTNSGLAALVGRPVAVAQAAVRLEVDGHPYLNLSWDYLGEDTDNGFSKVEFPVVLGNLKKLEDGLIGYFRQAAPDGPYDLSRFYSQGADENSTGGVVRPAQDTLCVTPTPSVDPKHIGGAVTQKVLMLVDPRAQVHASTGILPTASLALPPDQTQASLASLDFSFFTAPVLKGASALTLPTPVESGYEVSWVEQSKANGTLAWDVTPEIDSPSAKAVWAYTPQWLTEGWMRLNPVLLDFDLTDPAGKPVVTAGAPNALTLTITNKALRGIGFRPGTTVAEGTAPAGSIFYLHLGALVAQADVPLIGLSAPGWLFQLFSNPQYGAYWAAAPQTGVVLGEGASLTVEVTNLIPSAAASQAQVYFDYYEIDGLSDGVYVDVLAVHKAAQGTAAR